ncbi:MAG: ATP-binding cassette domain-containing protein [Betaproteobacteria bacterium]|nr:ATP-binding cassette domain-containing protein [Betaproteobacteria bacterium]
MRADAAFFQRRLQLVGGARVEQTNIHAQGPLTDLTLNVRRDASGKPLLDSAGRVIPITTDALETSRLTFLPRGSDIKKEYLRVFPSLNASYNVRENLIATAIPRAERNAPWDYARVVRLFPRLAERANNFGNQLSGGEQQMLAIGRALMTNPELLILDEATEGLSPLIRQEIWNALATVRAEGMSILVIDKNLRPLLELCDRHLIIEKGRVVWSGSSDELRGDQAAQQKYLSA